MSENVQLDIVLSAKDASSQAFNSVNKEVKKLKNELADLKNQKGVFASINSEISGLKSSVFSLKGLFSGIGIGLAAKEIFEAGVKADGLDRSFKAIAGTSSLAKKEMDFLRKTSNDLGLEFYSTADAYKGIYAASIGTNLEGEKTRDIFKSITQAGMALGLSQDDINGSLRAVTQMMSKGKVSAEELRQQLGERLPGAFQLAADAMGMSTSKFDKMMSTGKIMADDLLPKLATALNKKYGQAAMDSSDSAVASLNRFKTSWNDMLVDLAKSGAMDVATGVLKDMTANFKDLGAWIKDHKEEVSSFFRSLGILLKGVGVAGVWAASKVGWIPGWANDLGAALGMVSSGAIDLDQVVKAGSPKELHELVKNFDLNPMLVTLKTQKERLQIEIDGLKDQLNVSPFTKKMFNVFEPDYVPGLESNLKTRLARLESINKQIEQIKTKNLAPVQKKEEEPSLSNKGKQDKALTAEQEKAIKEREKLLADFNDRYRKIGLSSYDVERLQIDDLAKKWKKQGFDKIKIAEIVKDAKADILNKENAKNLEIQKEFEDKYREMGLSKYEIEGLKIDDLARKYRDAGADQVKVAQWVENEKSRIASEQTEKRQETLLEFNKLTLSSYAVERMEIEARAKKYMADGVDRVKLEEWMADQITQIRKKEEEERIRNSKEWRDGAVRALQDYADRASDVASGVEWAFSNAFTGMEDALVRFATTGKLSFTDMVNSMIADIARLAIRQSITGPLASALVTGMTSVFGPSDGFKSGVGIDHDYSGASSYAAHGNVYDISGFKMFSTGGVFTNHIVDKPTPFLFGRGGSFGVMGEAGAEAVVPLVRTRSGNLGIRSEGAQDPVVNVTIINQASGVAGRVESTARNENGGIDMTVIIEQIDGAMAAGITSGRSALSGAIETQYGMNRAYGVRR